MAKKTDKPTPPDLVRSSATEYLTLTILFKLAGALKCSPAEMVEMLMDELHH